MLCIVMGGRNYLDIECGDYWLGIIIIVRDRIG